LRWPPDSSFAAPEQVADVEHLRRLVDERVDFGLRQLADLEAELEFSRTVMCG